MARKYYNRARNYVRSQGRYFRQGTYGTRMGSFGRAYGKTGLNLSPAWLAGCAAAFVVPDNEMLTVGALAGSSMPVKGMGTIKGAAQGYVFGELLQKYVLPKVGINIGSPLGGGNTPTNVI